MFIRSLREQYSNDRRPPDGLVYERIRRYEGYLEDPVNRFAANNWWVVLDTMCGSKKAKYLRAFFKHPTLPQKLDKLLPIEGLWEGMRIGLLHKVLAMRCDEVRLTVSGKSSSVPVLMMLTGYHVLLGSDISNVPRSGGGELPVSASHRRLDCPSHPVASPEGFAERFQGLGE